MSYLVIRIEAGKLSYRDVVAKYPQFKEGIDETLAADGYVINEDGTCTKYVPTV